VPLALSAVATTLRASVFADLAPRIDARRRAGGDLVPLHIGDTYLTPPEGARFEERSPGEPALYGYGDIRGTMELREAIAARLASLGRAGAPIDPARELLLGVGATHALFCAARTLFEPGDDVLLASPYWPLAHGVLVAAGARPIEVPLTQRLYADPSLDAGSLFEAAITPRTRGVYLITPNNPDGKVLSRAQLESIARVAAAHDLWVVSDEVYADYVYDGEHVSFASLPGMRDRTVTAYSFSKSHAIAGARVGYVVAPTRVVDVAQRVATHTVFNVPVVSQRVAVAAIAGDRAWVDRARGLYRAARDAAVDALRGAPVRFSIAEGGSYLFLDFRELLGERPLVALLERAIDRGVLLAPGDASGAGFERCARLCFTSVPIERAHEGITRLRSAMEDLVGVG
jgi:aspartate/methionine/tyrosine aminotransferase